MLIQRPLERPRRGPPGRLEEDLHPCGPTFGSGGDALEEGRIESGIGKSQAKEGADLLLGESQIASRELGRLAPRTKSGRRESERLTRGEDQGGVGRSMLDKMPERLATAGRGDQHLRIVEHGESVPSRESRQETIDLGGGSDRILRKRAPVDGP